VRWSAARPQRDSAGQATNSLLFEADLALRWLSRDAARSAIIDEIKAAAEKATNPDAQAAVDGLIRFVQTPRQTLLLKLTPLGRVAAMQLGQLLKTDPLVALAQFRIEASTGL